MRISQVILAVGLGLAAGPAFGSVELLHDPFDDLIHWNDLSTAVTWGGNAGAVSAFDLTGGKVTLTADAQDHSGYVSADDLKTFTCLDHRFDSPIDRSGDDVTITVTFSAKWQSGSLSNEGSRFNVFLVHDYPSGGLDVDLDDRYDDFDQEWWARPAYNMRIRLGTDANLMMYAGGDTVEGEFEATDDWWLPGFSSAPDGDSPQPSEHGVVGAGTGTYSQSEFKTYQYVLGPDSQELWYDAEGDGFEPDDLMGTQGLDGGGTHPFDSEGYRIDFETIEGVRLYWRGSSGRAQAEIDWLRVEYVPEPATLALVAAGLAAAVVRRPRS